MRQHSSTASSIHFPERSPKKKTGNRASASVDVSMRHGVDDVIGANTIRKRSVAFRVLRTVGPFPRIPQVHVVTYGDYNAPFVVPNRSPFRVNAVSLVNSVCM